MRDFRVLMQEARELKTDEARQIWVNSLTPEERELFWNEVIVPLLEQG